MCFQQFMKYINPHCIFCLLSHVEPALGSKIEPNKSKKQTKSKARRGYESKLADQGPKKQSNEKSTPISLSRVPSFCLWPDSCSIFCNFQ